jgi:hypothetical protein
LGFRRGIALARARVFWNEVPHVDDDEHPEDKNWAASAPDVDAP